MILRLLFKLGHSINYFVFTLKANAHIKANEGGKADFYSLSYELKQKIISTAFVLISDVDDSFSLVCQVSSNIEFWAVLAANWSLRPGSYETSFEFSTWFLVHDETVKTYNSLTLTQMGSDSGSVEWISHFSASFVSVLAMIKLLTFNTFTSCLYNSLFSAISQFCPDCSMFSSNC